MATSLNDNLSILDYYVTTDYAINGAFPSNWGLACPRGWMISMPLRLTHRNHNILVAALPQPYKGLQASPDEHDRFGDRRCHGGRS